mmetsp:Transcript_11330/g.23785  ORF Transcript_11330/g.23785 Transcript_11330/m.23785 type:complete len:267 (+) Transcript_11330:150-950(+)
MRSHVRRLRDQDLTAQANLLCSVEHRLGDTPLELVGRRLRHHITATACDERHRRRPIAARNGACRPGLHCCLKHRGQVCELGGDMGLCQRVLRGLREHREVATAEAIDEQCCPPDVEDGRLAIHGLRGQCLTFFLSIRNEDHAHQAGRHRHTVAPKAFERVGAYLQSAVDSWAYIPGIPTTANGCLQETVHAIVLRKLVIATLGHLRKFGLHGTGAPIHGLHCGRCDRFAEVEFAALLAPHVGLVQHAELFVAKHAAGEVTSHEGG